MRGYSYSCVSDALLSSLLLSSHFIDTITTTTTNIDTNNRQDHLYDSPPPRSSMNRSSLTCPSAPYAICRLPVCLPCVPDSRFRILSPAAPQDRRWPARVPRLQTTAATLTTTVIGINPVSTDSPRSNPIPGNEDKKKKKRQKKFSTITTAAR
ncbi:hypothetical protein F5Y13DRAFT_84576 [Hypoxylon sp. FL1857]|nr:hypothetical protein F5Y13DRAFT_84576 [Hypoxylon sp. FL1857]